jgi:hypothetical protein
VLTLHLGFNLATGLPPLSAAGMLQPLLGIAVLERRAIRDKSSPRMLEVARLQVEATGIDAQARGRE